MNNYIYEKGLHDFMPVNNIHGISYPTEHNIHELYRQLCQII